MSNTDRVLAISDHIVAGAELVEYALRLTSPGGDCSRTHVESKRHFDPFVPTVEKIPKFETDDVPLTGPNPTPVSNPLHIMSISGRKTKL